MLADEMGLGKTIQTIAFIKELMFIQKITRPFLISVPLSTVENWRREFKLWCPEARLVVYQGKSSSRKIIEDLELYFDLQAPNGNDMAIPSFNVLLTSFDFLRTDFRVFTPIEWQALIIDEGQKMKNNNTSFFKRALGIHASFRVLLSGTPMQNNIDELFNLLQFLDPVKFGQPFRERMH